MDPIVPVQGGGGRKPKVPEYSPLLLKVSQVHLSPMTPPPPLQDPMK